MINFSINLFWTAPIVSTWFQGFTTMQFWFTLSLGEKLIVQCAVVQSSNMDSSREVFRCASISRISYDHHSLRPSLTHSLRHTSHLTQPILLDIALSTKPNYSHLTLPFPLDTKCYFDIALPSWYYNANLTLPFPLATIASPSHLKLSISPNLTILTWPSCSHLTLSFPFDLVILTSYCHANLTLTFLADLDLTTLTWYFHSNLT